MLLELSESNIHEERQYAEALAEAYAQAEHVENIPIERIASYPTYARHLSEQRQYYFAAESVRRATRDIYNEEVQFEVLKEEMHHYVKDEYEDPAASGLARLRLVQKRARD